jgi:hypothetical protein
MPYPEIHVIGIDPGGTTGWARFTVPRDCMYGNERSSVVSWDYGELTGPEDVQVDNLCRLARQTQSLSYMVGPALVCEDWDVDPSFKNTDTEYLSPVRIAAKLGYAIHLGKANDSRLTLQGRSIAFTTMNDDRLRRSGYWVEGSDHIRAATRHAITALRRAKESDKFRDVLWNAA